MNEMYSSLLMEVRNTIESYNALLKAVRIKIHRCLWISDSVLISSLNFKR